MIPTPDLSHLTRKDYDSIYEPAEDTFLLLDALEADMEFLKDRNPRLCLEIGSGSGCVSAFLGEIVGQKNSCKFSVLFQTEFDFFLTHQCIAVPISTLTQRLLPNAPGHKTTFAAFLSMHRIFDLKQLCVTVVRCSGLIDILLFNPPYVPTDSGEAFCGQDGINISSAWAGGKDGMQITESLLRNVKHLLSPTGCFYLVTVSQNKPAEIMHRMEEEHRLKSKVVLSRRAGREHLHILRFEKHAEEH